MALLRDSLDALHRWPYDPWGPASSIPVEDSFHHRGAYRRVKELLAADGCLEQWCVFEAEATGQALMAWCRDNGVHLVEHDEGPLP